MNNPLFISLLIFLGVTSPIFSQNKSDQPNFVIILADDLGYADVGFNGSTQIKTPHIDQLANEGIKFTQGYVSAPVCGPSRAGLMTGRNQVNFGVDNNITANLPQFDDNYAGVPVEEITIADRLAKLGYVNGIVGKWHLGEADHFFPTKRGFHEFWGYRGGGHNYFHQDPDGKKYNRALESNYKEPQQITYLTDDKGDECVDFIKRHKEESFFLYASFNAPHAPMQALEKDLALYEDIEDEKRRTYAAMIHRFDINVGRIINELKTQGVYENTVIVFLSDNGGPCHSNASLNAPLNGQKGVLLEGGIRVPFVISYPNKLQHGEYHQPISSLDLTPTFVALAGGKTTEKDKLDGVNIYPYITKEINGNPHETMMWRFTISAGIRKGNWKLIRLPDRLPMLYNIDKDPSELNDVAAENRDLVVSMLKELGDWDVSCPQPLYLEGARWRKKQVGLYDKKYKLTQPESSNKKMK
ncbi:sulfatase-like hydrolase/transferase [Flammeovirga pacifica]|uniref:Sulfatase n=1 Tax=Flammeovirga pacifica TaxID=915059 RepID=A0A1S1YUF7_FLAPC|nr:sulfatase-like hydrolase/transferase [Flammeovirga pacifica]OHX64660.1 sulfatase [Flammeovirga pacifica]